MKKRARPELLRQTITHYWQYYLSFTKNNRVGFNNIKFYLLWSSFIYHLSSNRPSHLKLRNMFIRREWKKATYRLDEIANYKLINLRNNIRNTLIFFFCNIVSRTEVIPKKSNTFEHTAISFRNKKRLARFNYTFFLFKKHYFSKTFSKIVLKTRNDTNLSNLLQCIYSKSSTVKLNYLKTKKTIYGKRNNRSQFFDPLNNGVRKLYRKRNSITEITEWQKDSQFLKILTLKSLSFRIRKIKKRQKKIWKALKHPNNKFFFFIIFQKLKQKTTSNLFSFWKKMTEKNKNKKYKFFWLWKKLKIINGKDKSGYSVKRNKKKKYFLKTKGLEKQNVNTFWYTQFLNKFITIKFKQFNLSVSGKKKFSNYNLVFQQEFSFPNGSVILQTINKRIRIMTSFLKGNKKFYNNFLNILPVISTFKNTALYINQLAIELARTKKHWRVIRGAETLFLQNFIQLRKEPIEGKGGFFGFHLIIRGRPNKIARTKKFFFGIGKIKKSEFRSSAVFQSFSASKAQIGSFGISGISSTT